MSSLINTNLNNIINKKVNAVINNTISESFDMIKQCEGKYTVLLFYPLDFTFVCPTEILAFNADLEKFEKLNSQVIGISVDSVHCHYAWLHTERQKGGIKGVNFPLVSDFDRNLAKSFNVLKEDEHVAYRGMFIVDPNLNIRIAHVNDLPIGRSVNEVLRLIEALDTYDKYGEVCPGNWVKGGKTIKPDHEGAKEYFES